ncbi:NADH:flavin oxidoreductase/NADH oxidase [Microbacteriaceae bacterium K1510]|jgi:2,4-dienoyl-CoA reductase-like NADH-dependent reductase (Old Yellow Enzyme family)|uniref:NADH:flavin oxidoreductase/NADH oxidase n=1 Tax=Microbacterium sp. 4NA327F11 TaxID=2502229 RepID=UPI0010F5C3CC|nr:NADH:flavin oxidoreductase/NADH oxidase [Microbacterium sp. 4NA327F11]MBN9209147.1 NADH:flavin oxidoreductase/NADH oxidase [Microbacterium ginsengisoli]MCK9914907.1 NADH:flavin oxidoreductase/NADH oxidase [Microbacteriaceae bacterium K1510]
MSTLFAPLTLRGTTLRNRLWVAPMCQYSAVDGLPNDWHHVHLAQFASGGAGLVLAEATAVSPDGRISPADVGLWNDAQAQAWAPIVAAVHARGAAVGVQLAHAGRKASTWPPFAPQRGTVPPADGGWEPVAPSSIAFEGLVDPRELTIAAIDGIVDDFAAAAVRAVAIGFDVLEIHAAHGYLLHEFLSPLANTRTDAYGGSLENRARLVLRVVETVRRAAPDTVVFVRFSGTDWAPGGLEVAEVVEVARWSAERGADLFDVSSGGLVAHQQIPVGPGYQVPLARALRDAGLPAAAVGLITDGPQAESILTAGDADAILAAREWLRDPHFGLRAATEIGADVPWPPQYERARRRTH